MINNTGLLLVFSLIHNRVNIYQTCSRFISTHHFVDRRIFIQDRPGSTAVSTNSQNRYTNSACIFVTFIFFSFLFSYFGAIFLCHVIIFSEKKRRDQYLVFLKINVFSWFQFGAFPLLYSLLLFDSGDALGMLLMEKFPHRDGFGWSVLLEFVLKLFGIFLWIRFSI